MRTTVPTSKEHPNSKFSITWTICGASSFCASQTWSNIVDPSPFPDVVAVKGTDTDSHDWVFPVDTTTSQCTYEKDCHSFLSLSLEVDSCNACANYKTTQTCDMTCTTFTQFTHVSFTELHPINGVYKFTILGTWDTRKNYVARIKGYNLTLGVNVYSPNFLLLAEASHECNIAVLTVPTPEPSVVFNPIKPPFGQTDSVSITTWPTFENDVCPEFCHGTTDCGDPIYSLRCNTLAASPPYTIDPHA